MVTNETRREVMELAWDLFRAAAKEANPRTFANALAGAWRWVKGRAERLAKAPKWTRTGGHVRLNTMLQSPVRRSLGAQAYAGVSAARADYVTTCVGR